MYHKDTKQESLLPTCFKQSSEINNNNNNIFLSFSKITLYWYLVIFQYFIVLSYKIPYWRMKDTCIWELKIC